ncbi:MAG: cysteine desulfurase [Clostridiales bacterium]|jgi:cysteine desulfurase|nr:cysteine desulfurase [Clostridiales bacterium]
MIYLDNAGTMPPPKEAGSEFKEFNGLSDNFFNPSATYRGGILVKNRIDAVRNDLAGALRVPAEAVFFTSGATEANNWIFSGAVKNKKYGVVISAGEHASVYEPAMYLKNAGFDVRVAALTGQGTVDRADFLSKLDENTGLISLIHVSNETGAVNDLAALSGLARAICPKAVFHADGVQALGKLPLDLSASGLDAYSFSGHKVGAFKGIGGLYVKPGVSIRPFMLGGGQESGMRSGTENVPGILSFGRAFAAFSRQAAENASEIRGNFAYLVDRLSAIEGVSVAGDPANNAGYILTLLIAGVRAEVLQTLLYDKGVAVGRGAACSSKKPGNRILEAMGHGKKEIEGALRLSLSPFTKREALKRAATAIEESILTMRGYRIG